MELKLRITSLPKDFLHWTNEVSLIFSSLMTLDWVILVLLLVSKFSFDLALFNMLPFSILDGAKVIRWNQAVFALVFSLSLVSWLFHPLGILGGVFSV